MVDTRSECRQPTSIPSCVFLAGARHHQWPKTAATHRPDIDASDAAAAGRGIVTPLRACGPAGGSVAKRMKKISYRGYRFPPEIIQQAMWLYLRFTLSFRDVEDLLAERGIMVSYETVRRWVNHHFGPHDRGGSAQT
jgi:hypothetical protein